MLVTKNYVDSSISTTSIRLTSQTIAGSVVAGDAVSYNGSQWVKSNNCVGVYEGNNAVVLKGAITLSGLTAGSFYYCTLNGSLTTSRTEAFNDTKVGYAISSTVMLIDIDREVTAPYTGDLGIFGGGTQGASSRQSKIEYINISSPSNAANYGTLTRTRAYTTANSNGANQRACFAGSYSATSTDIDYVSLTVASNAALFGQLSNDRYNMGSCSNNTNNRGVFGPGNTEATILDYITISTLSNSQSFGNLSVARSYCTASTSNGTNNRGIWAGSNSPETSRNVIDYITITTPGTATDFGDMQYGRYDQACTSNNTNERGVIAGADYWTGSAWVLTNLIEYITISTLSNSATFGDLTRTERLSAGLSNGINNRGVFAGGTVSNIIDYITISTTGNAIDFGDLNYNGAWNGLGGASNA